MLAGQLVLFAKINADELIPLVVMVIGIIAWLVKHLSTSQQNEAAPKPRPRPKPNANLEAEIQDFLGDVNSTQKERLRRPQRQETGAPPRPPQPRKTPAPKPPARVQQNRQQPAAAGDSSAPSSTAKRSLGREITERSGPGSRDLGTGVREHVAASVAPRVQKQVEADLAPLVAKSVSQHLGQFEALQVASVSSRRRNPIAEHLFTNRDSMRIAVLMNTILSRPKVLQKPTEGLDVLSRR